MTTDGRLLNIACDTYKGDVYLVAQNTVSGEKSIIATEKLSGAVMALYFASSGGISKPYVTIKNKIGDGSYRLFLALFPRYRHYKTGRQGAQVYLKVRGVVIAEYRLFEPEISNANIKNI